MSEAFGAPLPPRPEETPPPARTPETGRSRAEAFFDNLADRFAQAAVQKSESEPSADQPIAEGDHSSYKTSGSDFDAEGDWSHVKANPDRNIFKHSDPKEVHGEARVDFSAVFGRERGKTISGHRAAKVAKGAQVRAEQDKQHQKKLDKERRKQPAYEALAKPITGLVDDASIVFRGINRNGRGKRKDGAKIPDNEKVGLARRALSLVRGVGAVATVALAPKAIDATGESVKTFGDSLDASLIQEFGAKVAELDVPPSLLPAAIAVGGVMTVVGRMFGNLRAGRKTLEAARNNETYPSGNSYAAKARRSEMARTKNLFHPVKPRPGQRQWKYTSPAMRK